MTSLTKAGARPAETTVPPPLVRFEQLNEERNVTRFLEIRVPVSPQYADRFRAARVRSRPTIRVPAFLSLDDPATGLQVFESALEHDLDLTDRLAELDLAPLAHDLIPEYARLTREIASQPPEEVLARAADGAPSFLGYALSAIGAPLNRCARDFLARHGVAPGSETEVLEEPALLRAARPMLTGKTLGQFPPEEQRAALRHALARAGGFFANLARGVPAHVGAGEFESLGTLAEIEKALAASELNDIRSGREREKTERLQAMGDAVFALTEDRRLLLARKHCKGVVAATYDAIQRHVLDRIRAPIHIACLNDPHRGASGWGVRLLWNAPAHADEDYQPEIVDREAEAPSLTALEALDTVLAYLASDEARSLGLTAQPASNTFGITESVRVDLGGMYGDYLESETVWFHEIFAQPTTPTAHILVIEIARTREGGGA